MGEIRKITQEAFLEWAIKCGKGTPITTTMAVKSLGLTRSSVTSHLGRLKDAGFLIRASRGIYYLADQNNKTKAHAGTTLADLSNEEVCRELIRRIETLSEYQKGMIAGALLLRCS